MLVELRSKSQITIPKQIVNKLDLHEGDQFEVIEKDGIINLVPVTVYPKDYIEQLEAEVKQLKKNIREGKVSTSLSIDEILWPLSQAELLGFFTAHQWFLTVRRKCVRFCSVLGYIDRKIDKCYAIINDILGGVLLRAKFLFCCWL